MNSDLDPLSIEYPDLYLCFSHKEISIISDRTYTALSKSFKRICREIIKQEVDLFLAETELHENYKQSLRDRISKQIQAGNIFYLEDIKKGSLEVTVMLTALGIWFLANTIGEDIKAIYKESRLSKKVRNILGKEISKIEVKKIFQTLLKFNNRRGNNIADRLIVSYKNRVIGERFVIDDIIVEQNDERIKITFYIKTIRATEEELTMEKFDSSKAKKEIERIIKLLK